MGMQEYEGPVEIHRLSEGVHLIRPAEPPAPDDDAQRCAKCRRPFDPTDTRFDGAAQHARTPFCRECVDRCHDTEIADHWCAVDQHWTDMRATDDVD